MWQLSGPNSHGYPVASARELCPNPQGKSSEAREPYPESYPRAIPRTIPAIHTPYTNLPARPRQKTHTPICYYILLLGWGWPNTRFVTFHAEKRACRSTLAVEAANRGNSRFWKRTMSEKNGESTPRTSSCFGKPVFCNLRKFTRSFRSTETS